LGFCPWGFRANADAISPETLEVAVFNSLVSAEWFVRDLLTHRVSEEQREKANAEHAEAAETREALAGEVRSLS
jgi:hypothetical protein